MRALVLILTSVVLIAVVQTSYIAIDKATDEKHKDAKARPHGHHKQDRHHNRGGGHGPNHNTLTNEINVPTTNEFERPPIQPTSLNKLNGHKHHDKKSAEINNDSRAITSDYNAVYHIPKDRTQYVREDHHDRVRLRIDGTPNTIDFGKRRKDRIDEPFNDKHNKGTFSGERHRGKSLFSKSSGDDKRWSAKHHKYERLNFVDKARKSSDVYHKANEYTKSSCTSDDECDGGCCIQLRNGKSKCKTPFERGVGQKCASSCVCTPGLQCFIGTYKKNGQKKATKEGRKLWGHCMAQDMADPSKGYFMPTKNDIVNEKL